jgi:iron complex outermembrane receptor protein
MAGYTWKIGRSLAHLQLNVDNLLDKGYFEGGAFFGPYRIIPGAPRTFLGSIRVEF